MWPPDDELLAAWRELVADPLLAGGRFAALVLDPLVADLARRHPNDDPGHVGTAAGDAVLDFLRQPDKYDPTRAPLPAYLRHIAGRDLANARQQERRHHRGRIPADPVELGLPDRKEEEGDELPGFDSPALRSVIDAMSADERRVFDLMRDGERDTAVFAAALGITDRPSDEQAAIVKRVKDAIKARLKRAGGKT